MQMMRKQTLSLLLIALAGSLPATAHHSTAIYDHENKVLIEGTVTQFKWTNPHSWLYMKVPDGKGGTEDWAIEAGTVVQLINVGWTREKVKPGDKVKVVAVIARDGSRKGEIHSLITASGETLKNKVAF
jgi:hypothetical protein